MSEPMSAERLEGISNLIAGTCYGYDTPCHCLFIDVTDLIAEVRRLQRENTLLHLSRGSEPMLVGQD